MTTVLLNCWYPKGVILCPYTVSLYMTELQKVTSKNNKIGSS